MLYKNENIRQLNVFSFLEPFTIEIWILMLFSYVLVSSVFYWISKHHEKYVEEKTTLLICRLSVSEAQDITKDLLKILTLPC